MVVELRPREAAAEAAAAELVMRTQAGAPAQWWVSQRTRRSTAASLCRLEGLGVRESNWAGGRGGLPAVAARGRGEVCLAMVLVGKHVKPYTSILRGRTSRWELQRAENNRGRAEVRTCSSVCIRLYTDTFSPRISFITV